MSLLWVRGEPLHEGSLFDLTLRDLLDLDLMLARYTGLLSHWWEIPDAIEDISSMPADLRLEHPEAYLALTVRVWGSMRRSGRSDSLADILDSGLEWTEVQVTGADSEPDDDLPPGFRPGNVQAGRPDVEGMDLLREVGTRYLLIARYLRISWDDVWSLPLWVWLGVAAQVDSLRG